MIYTIKTSFVIVSVFLGMLIGWLLASIAQPVKPKEPIVQVMQPKPEPQSYIKITKQDLEIDITSNYQDISNRTKREILDTIESTSKEYGINPLILYALLHTESSMRPHTQHTECIVDVKGKKVKTRALGIAAIIPELWEEKLTTANIISTKSDLLDPILAIRAAGYILDHNYKLPMHKNATSKDGSALLHYFGAANNSYFEKINSKVTSITLKGLYR